MGIIKTAMMSGAAMYGVNKLAKSPARVALLNEETPRPEQYDPEYRAWLEWRSRQGTGSPMTQAQMGGSRNEEPQRQLSNYDANFDPRYEHADFDRRQSQQLPQYHSVEYRPQRETGSEDEGVTRQSNHAGPFDYNALSRRRLRPRLPPPGKPRCRHPSDHDALSYTQSAVHQDEFNSYLPFTGQTRLRNVAAMHVSQLSGVKYTGERNCVISTGGLSGILNVLLATIEEGDEVIMTDPTYRGLINRVLLAGGVPKLVPFTFHPGREWQLDRQALRSAISERTTAMLLMSPSMPTGGYLDREDWHLVSELCVPNDLLLILDAAMERLVFDRRGIVSPAGLPGVAERTVIVGSSAKELRMIGWRVGWIVGPEDLMRDIAAVSMANVVVPVGIAQEAVAIALEESSISSTSMAGYVNELQARRDLNLSELEGLPVGVPAGGWCLLLRVSDFGIDGATASKRFLSQGVCATSMDGWGDVHGRQYIRFVFSNEPLDRLKGLGKKVRQALEVP
ncbi:hypothetical protein PV11_06969 [Exophiala sideris]|uniref:Aminotransferase class I/classII large domain-containing protein n=1 Tax=Exophiala sideris TaxID=1016849 RepID=A0A0D1Y915_9EURO|nr:hypothetical protein PV11_06969 [Exophiala sideris]